MHFAKAYPQLLESLPPELQDISIQYRHLKKVINQIVKELSTLGLSPALLHRLLYNRDGELDTSLESSKDTGAPSLPSTSGRVPCSDPVPIIGNPVLPGVVYELSGDLSRIESRLRISVATSKDMSVISYFGVQGRDAEQQNETSTSLRDGTPEPEDINSGMSTEISQYTFPMAENLPWKLGTAGLENHTLKGYSTHTQSELREIIIPLCADSQFFELLLTALDHISAHLESVEDKFMEALKTLSTTIGESARPTSYSKFARGRSFRAWSPLKDHAGAIHVHHKSLSNSDLYVWREIFQLYMEAEIFQCIRGHDDENRSADESERRLQLFQGQVTQRWLTAKGKFKLEQSCRALETFIQLNVFILNIRKFQFANAEAVRKILKKYKRRTALSLPPVATLPPSECSPPQLALVSQVHSFSLPRILIQAITEILLPVVPHLDDYSCLICTSIAFKPIRLDCGHLFCLRCLVKMQKRGKGDCPICRSPCVLVADQSNVDWALMNFMRDWFPLEAREKLKADAKEANVEKVEELGLYPDTPCLIM